MSLPHALLGLLEIGPGSGYDLLKRFDGAMAYVWPATQSQLYTELGKLDRAGLVAVTHEGPRGRKEYELTAAGRNELHRWLTDTEPEHARRFENVLRVFFLWDEDPGQAVAYFKREAELAEAFLAELQAIADANDWEQLPRWARFARIALEQGLRSTQANLEWSTWAADEVAAIPAESRRRANRTPR
jgi:DNA-binding PadR family transcriptional regulator